MLDENAKFPLFRVLVGTSRPRLCCVSVTFQHRFQIHLSSSWEPHSNIQTFKHLNIQISFPKYTRPPTSQDQLGSTMANLITKVTVFTHHVAFPPSHSNKHSNTHTQTQPKSPRRQLSERDQQQQSETSSGRESLLLAFAAVHHALWCVYAGATHCPPPARMQARCGRWPKGP